MMEDAMQKQFRGDLAWLMAHEEGRRLLLFILGGICRVNASCMENDARSTDFALGRRAAGLDLIKLADHVAPEAYLKAQDEYRMFRQMIEVKLKVEKEKVDELV